MTSYLSKVFFAAKPFNILIIKILLKYGDFKMQKIKHNYKSREVQSSY